MPNLKLLALTVHDIWRGSQNFKSRSRDPFSTPFDPALTSFCRWMIKNGFPWKNRPGKNSFFPHKLVFASSWQKKNHNQKYFRNYKTSQTY